MLTSGKGTLLNATVSIFPPFHFVPPVNGKEMKQLLVFSFWKLWTFFYFYPYFCYKLPSRQDKLAEGGMENYRWIFFVSSKKTGRRGGRRVNLVFMAWLNGFENENTNLKNISVSIEYHGHAAVSLKSCIFLHKTAALALKSR